MDIVAIFSIYAVSLLVAGLPLVLIVRAGALQKHFVHLVAISSFLAINLVGTGFRSVVDGYRSVGYHVVVLLEAAVLCLSFMALEVLSSRRPVRKLAERLAPSVAASSRLLRRLAWLLQGFAAGATIILTSTVAPPLLFRVDLLGNWPELVARRITIVFGGRFHWYALVFFDTPLFLVTLVTVCIRVLPAASAPRERRGWRTLYRVAVPFALVASVLFLNKQYIVYLLAAMTLVALLFSPRVRLGPLLGFGAAMFVALALLYAAYTGFDAGAIVSLIVHRTFEVYPLAAAAVFDLFPRHMAFLGGASLLNPFGILAVPFVSVAEIVYPILYGDIGFGSAPLPAVFESYANFGWWGIIGSLVSIMAMLAIITLMSWSRSVAVFSLSVYWAIKTILLWQGPFWFGALEPTLLVFTTGVLLFFGLSSTWAARRGRMRTVPSEGR